MLINWRRACALTLAAALGAAGMATAAQTPTAQTPKAQSQAAQAPSGRAPSGKLLSGKPATASPLTKLAFEHMDAAASDDVRLASCACDDCGAVDGCECADDCGCGDACGIEGCGIGGGIGLGRFVPALRGGQVVGGAEWLSLRAQYSDATAYRETNLNDSSETLVQYHFDYTDSYRVFAGYQFCNCGGQVLFTYSRLNGNGGFNAGPLDTQNGTVSRESPYEVVLAGQGDVLQGTARVRANIYDIAYAKTIPLGSPLGCCNPCDPCCGSCPAWDLQWIGGIRVANIDSSLNYQSTINSSSVVPGRVATSSVSFNGVGLRGGVLGRRYIGRSGIASVYVRGDISLLLGDVNYSAVGTAFPRTSISSSEVIPVTDLEAGGTLFLTRHISVSTGYFLSAWHDLGHRAEYDYSVTGTQLQSMDDANMLMFDGLFVRMQAVF